MYENLVPPSKKKIQQREVAIETFKCILILPCYRARYYLTKSLRTYTLLRNFSKIFFLHKTEAFSLRSYSMKKTDGKSMEEW